MLGSLAHHSSKWLRCWLDPWPWPWSTIGIYSAPMVIPCSFRQVNLLLRQRCCAAHWSQNKVKGDVYSACGFLRSESMLWMSNPAAPICGMSLDEYLEAPMIFLSPTRKVNLYSGSQLFLWSFGLRGKQFGRASSCSLRAKQFFGTARCWWLPQDRTRWGTMTLATWCRSCMLPGNRKCSSHRPSFYLYHCFSLH